MDSITQQLLAEPRLQLYLAGALCVVATVLLLLTGRSRTEPPGPWFTIPLLGETVELITSPPLKFQWKRVQKYGSVFSIQIMGQRIYMTSDPDAIRRMAKNEGVKFMMPGPAANKMFGAYDQQLDRKWHTQWRKYILMAIGPAGIAELFPKLQHLVDVHIADWEVKGRFSLSSAFKDMAYDFGVDVITGMDIPADVDRAWFKQQVMVVIEGLYGLPFDLPFTRLRRGLDAKKAIRKAFSASLQQTIKDVERKMEELGDKDPDQGTVLPLLEATLLTSKGYAGIDETMGVNRIVGNLVAATDTTRYMLWITMSLAAKAPRVIEKLREEQAQLVAKYGAKITLEAVQEMVYLDATVKESMRIMPASVFTFRETTAPFQVGKYVIPKGATIAVSSILPQAMDPVLWDGPPDFTKATPPHMDWEHNFEDAFRPERWLPDSPAKPRGYATFGAGEFLCLGQQLAYTEAKLVMATVLRKYRYSFVDPEWLSKCGYFPGPAPKPGTDLVDLVVDPVAGC